MSSLYKPEGVIYDQGTSSAVESGSDAGREQGTPGRSPISGRKDGNVSVRAGMGMKRSGTLPSFPSMESLKAVSKGKAVEIPVSILGSRWYYSILTVRLIQKHGLVRWNTLSICTTALTFSL